MHYEMKKKIKHITWILVAVILVSCKKETEEYYGYCFEYISSSIKPYMFKNGSYWVYENDSTHILDSIVVTSTTHSFFSPYPSKGGPALSVEYYKINLHDFFNSSDFDDFIFNSYINRNADANTASFGQPILFTNDTIGYSNCGAYLWDTLTTLNIYGNTFNKIKVMKVIADEQNYHYFSNDTYLYYSDSIGLIRKVIDLGSSTESWSLKRWNVNL